MFLLDTDHLVILQRRTPPEYSRLKARMRRHDPQHFFVSIVSFHEEVNGWNAYLNRAKNIDGIIHAYGMYQDLLTDFARRRVLPFDRRAGEIFESLRKQRIRIGTMDLRIAAIAIADRYTVLSRNLADFRQVPGLIAEDWTGP
jgi:tRNA(fMet)-specific endonuclease VapC